MSTTLTNRDRAKLRTALERNRRRRSKAQAEVDAARLELVALLERGRGRFAITELAQLAGVSRETVYQLLRRGEEKR